MSRRKFTKFAMSSATLLITSPKIAFSKKLIDGYPIRLGGPIFEKYENPDSWIKAAKDLGYSAVYCPVGEEEDMYVIEAYSEAAQKADIIISEVGAWSNPISSNEETRKRAIEKCRKSLALADQIGAKCCVNISGSRNEEHWDGPHKDNLTKETFDLIVETTREIIDDVKPIRTYFTLEPMPWAYPDSVDSYLKLIKAIDRKQFAVHFDPVNLVSSPQIYFKNGELIKDFFKRLGPYIKSCHAKDTLISETNLTIHLDEVSPGSGYLDYGTFLRELSKLPDVPLMIEHLKTTEEYQLAAGYIRSIGTGMGLAFY